LLPLVFLTCDDLEVILSSETDSQTARAASDGKRIVKSLGSNTNFCIHIIFGANFQNR